jgi:mersacidin/lichenicidin family type 2 lantibiotic
MSHLDIIRAWKDETYRQSLSEAEHALLPDNPAGLIELPDASLTAIVGGFQLEDQTISADLGVCCCESWDYCDTYRSIVCMCVELPGEFKVH